jgi:hypothetical protein
MHNFNNAASLKVNAMTPEEEARQEIDRLLGAAGWQVQDYKNLNLGAALPLAEGSYHLVTECLLMHIFIAFAQKTVSQPQLRQWGH